jgi:hypothetical protein
VASRVIEGTQEVCFWPKALLPCGINDEALAKADRFVLDVAEVAVELDHSCVGGTNKQIDLGDARADEQLFNVLHQLFAMAMTTMGPRYREVVDPSAVAVVPRHDSRDQFFAVGPHKKPLRLHSELARDVLVGIVPRACDATFLPEGDYGGLIQDAVRADFHGASIER